MRPSVRLDPVPGGGEFTELVPTHKLFCSDPSGAYKKCGAQPGFAQRCSSVLVLRKRAVIKGNRQAAALRQSCEVFAVGGERNGIPIVRALGKDFVISDNAADGRSL